VLAENETQRTLQGLPENTNLLIEGTFNSPFKILRVTPVTDEFIKNTLTI